MKSLHSKSYSKVFSALSVLAIFSLGSLLGILESTPAFAQAQACCTVTSESSTKIVLSCPGLNAEAQIRIEGSKSAALLRYHEAFGPSDVGTYFESTELAVVTANITGEAQSRKIVLNTFLDSARRINWLISYHTPSGKAFATSSFGNEGTRCEEVPYVVSIAKSEVPQGYSLVSASTSASRPEVVLARLFGSK